MHPPSWLMAAPALVVTVVVVYGGSIAASYFAFTDWNALEPPRWVGFKNFSTILQDPHMRGSLVTTLQLAVGFFVLGNAFGLALALGLNRAMRGRTFLRSLFLVPAVLSPLAVGYAWRYILDFQGPLNNLLAFVGLESLRRPWIGDPTFAKWTVLVALLWQFIGLIMVIYLAGLQGIPDELDEAAAIDGATSWVRFRRITLPLLAPATTIVTTMTIIFALRIFDQVLIITGGGPAGASDTMATVMYSQTFAMGYFGYGSAMAVLLALFIAAVVTLNMVIRHTREARL